MSDAPLPPDENSPSPSVLGEDLGEGLYIIPQSSFIVYSSLSPSTHLPHLHAPCDKLPNEPL